jgi:hypothetical protein
VPRSITVKEYLPLLQRNPMPSASAGGRRAGRVVSRGRSTLPPTTPSTFPFSLRQPPSDGNALGKVKFMFPNPYNIYLHDTPSKALFAQDRAGLFAMAASGWPTRSTWRMRCCRCSRPTMPRRSSTALKTGQETR